MLAAPPPATLQVQCWRGIVWKSLSPFCLFSFYLPEGASVTHLDSNPTKHLPVSQGGVLAKGDIRLTRIQAEILCYNHTPLTSYHGETHPGHGTTVTHLKF